MKNIRKLLWLFLGLFIILSQINLMADLRERNCRPYKHGDPKHGKIKTKIINNTKDYKLWLSTDVTPLDTITVLPYVWSQIAGQEYSNSAGAQWVDPGHSSEAISHRYAPQGSGLIYYTKEKSPGRFTKTNYEEIDLNGQNGQYPFSEITVDVQAKPVLINSGNRTCTYFDYTITVTQSQT